MKRLQQILEQPFTGTPTGEFERQLNLFKNAVKKVQDNIAPLEKMYRAQLADDAESWRGIGKGTEMADLVNRAQELAEFLDSLV
jgi:hypothetical protein